MSTQATLASLQVGRVQKRIDQESGNTWTTGFEKTPMVGPVHLARTRLAGDEQADLAHHGGPDKAVCVYSADHYLGWRAELSLPDLKFGGFGENFSVAHLEETSVCLGDRWAIGTAIVEISQPRQPCWKLARSRGIKDLLLRVIQSGRTGWYFRVIEAGDVQKGDPLLLQDRPFPEWTVARTNHVYYHDRLNATAARELVAVSALAEVWKTDLRKRL